MAADRLLQIFFYFFNGIAERMHTLQDGYKAVISARLLWFNNDAKCVRLHMPIIAYLLRFRKDFSRRIASSAARVKSSPSFEDGFRIVIYFKIARAGPSPAILTFYKKKSYCTHGYKDTRAATPRISPAHRQRATFGLAKSAKRVGTAYMECYHRT